MGVALEPAMTGHSFAIFDTAIGRCGIVWGARGIKGVQLPMGSEDKTRTRLRQVHGDIAEAPPPAEVQSAIDGIIELLVGKPNDLNDVVIDLDGVPEFNRGVYDIARTILPGKTLTYGDIARRLGGVELSRDVGQALGRNPCPIVVPCHRVLAAGGEHAMAGHHDRTGIAPERLADIARQLDATEPLCNVSVSQRLAGRNAARDIVDAAVEFGNAVEIDHNIV